MRVRVGVLLFAARDFPKMLAYYRDQVGLPVGEVDPGAGYQPLVDWVRFEPNGPEDVALEFLMKRSIRESFRHRLPATTLLQ